MFIQERGPPLEYESNLRLVVGQAENKIDWFWEVQSEVFRTDSIHAKNKKTFFLFVGTRFWLVTLISTYEASIHQG